MLALFGLVGWGHTIGFTFNTLCMLGVVLFGVCVGGLVCLVGACFCWVRVGWVGGLLVNCIVVVLCLYFLCDFCV